MPFRRIYELARIVVFYRRFFRTLILKFETRFTNRLYDYIDIKVALMKSSRVKI